MREYAEGEMGTFREMAVSGQTSHQGGKVYVHVCVCVFLRHHQLGISEGLLSGSVRFRVTAHYTKAGSPLFLNKIPMKLLIHTGAHVSFWKTLHSSFSIIH